MKLIDAVYEVLKGSDAPMGGDEIERIIRERGLYETKGKTLYASIGSALYTDMNKLGAGSRFVKCGKGRFALKDCAAAKLQPELALGVGHAVSNSEPDLQTGSELQNRCGKSVKAQPNSGYVYILTNPSFRRDWVKIGKTCRKVNVRSAELDNTAVPLPFEVFATMRTVDYDKAERLIHKMIDRFTKKRIRKNREFFNIEPEKALEIFEDVQMVFDDAVIERFGAEKATGRKHSDMSGRTVTDSQNGVFFCRGSGSDAKGKIVEGGFAVLRGSRMSPKVTPTMEKYAPKMFNLRKQLERDGTIVKGVFKQQYVFTSPSAAACLIEGHNTSGNCDWRTADGVKLGEVTARSVEAK